MQVNGHDLEVATIRDLIRTRAVLGEKPLAIVDGTVLTYVDADRRANALANRFAELGVAKGDVVATYMYNSTDHILVWFAAAKLGARWAPLNVALVKQDLAYTIGDCAPRVIVLDEELLPAYREVRAETSSGRVEVVRGTVPDEDGWLALDDLRDGPETEPTVAVEPDDPAGLIYTGGTTGLPKAVEVTNFWYFPGALRYFEMLDPTPQDVHLALGQMCHTIGSAVDILTPMYWQMTTVGTRWFSVSRFWETVRQHGCTLTVLLGTLMARLLTPDERPNDRDNTLRLAVSVTGGMPREQIERFSQRFGVPLLETYGQTEAGPLGCINQRLEDLPRVSQGSPHGWIELRIADADGTTCPSGIVGEILLRPTVPGSFMRGYLNKPGRFELACRDLWFHSGDLGYLDKYGDLHFAGRMAHMIRHRGENVSAIEIEQVLLTHPSVRNCAVIGVANDVGEDDIKAVVQLAAGAHVTELQLVQHCEAHIAYFKVPRYVEFVDELPLSVTKGDVERHKLHALGKGAAWDREAAGYQVRRAR